MNKKEKNEMIVTLEGMLNDNKNFYLADISGLTAEENSALRRLCFKREVSLQVVKNTLLKQAFETNDADEFVRIFNEPTTAEAMSEDKIIGGVEMFILDETLKL